MYGYTFIFSSPVQKLLLSCCCFTSMVNSYGNVGMVCTIVQGAIVVTLTSVLASHFKIFYESFYMMGKVLSGELFCSWTGLVLSGHVTQT